MRITFFKLPGHNVFDYQPRYYDPEKEEFEARVAKAKQEVGAIPEGEYRPTIKGQFRRRYASDRLRKGRRYSNLRLFVIIGILLVIAYYLLYY